MERQKVVIDFTLAYFQNQFENIKQGDTSLVVFPTVDKHTISINKLAVIRFMYVLWEGVDMVYDDILSFADVLSDISFYYDAHYPYMDLHTGIVRVVHTIDDFGFFANEILDMVLREKGVLWPSSATSLREWTQYMSNTSTNAFILPNASVVDSIPLPINTEKVPMAEHVQYWMRKLDTWSYRDSTELKEILGIDIRERDTTGFTWHESIRSVMQSNTPENVKFMLEKYYTNHFPISIKLCGGIHKGKQTTLTVLVSRSGRLAYNDIRINHAHNNDYRTSQLYLDPKYDGIYVAKPLLDSLFRNASGTLIFPFDFENGDIKSLETQIGALHTLTERVSTPADLTTLTEELLYIVDSHMTDDIADIIKISNDEIVLEKLRSIFNILYPRGLSKQSFGWGFVNQIELATMLTQIGRFTFPGVATDTKRTLEGLDLFTSLDLGEIFKSVGSVFTPNFIKPSGTNDLPPDISKMLEGLWKGVVHDEIRNLPHDKLLAYMDIYFESLVDSAMVFENTEFDTVFYSRIALKLVALFLVALIMQVMPLSIVPRRVKALVTLLLLVSYAECFAPFAGWIVLVEVVRLLENMR